MPVYVENIHSAIQVPRAVIVRTVKSVLQGEACDNARITIVFVEDEYIRTLNKRYLGRDRATDVLSFGVNEGNASDGDMLGDVYVSLDRTREQAVRYGVSLIDEVKRLVVHGCLHLLGYDHHTDRDRRIMRQKEEAYLIG